MEDEFVFPQEIYRDGDGNIITQGFSPSLTKRELFAAMALTGYIAKGDFEGALAQEETYASLAVEAADALIAQLSKDGE